MIYENQRDEFDRIVKIYKEYVDIYKFFNGGSEEGATPFDVFYWNMTFHSVYDHNDRIQYGQGF